MNREDIALDVEELEERIAPAIVGVQLNGGGNTPNGQANGVPTVNQNPAFNRRPLLEIENAHRQSLVREHGTVCPECVLPVCGTLHRAQNRLQLGAHILGAVIR